MFLVTVPSYTQDLIELVSFASKNIIFLANFLRGVIQINYIVDNTNYQLLQFLD